MDKTIPLLKTRQIRDVIRYNLQNYVKAKANQKSKLIVKKYYHETKSRQIIEEIKYKLQNKVKEKVIKTTKVIVRAYHKIKLKQMFENLMKRIGDKIKSAKNKQKNLPIKKFKFGMNNFELGKVHLIDKKVGNVNLLKHSKHNKFIEKEIPQKFFIFDATKFKIGEAFKVKSYGHYVKKPKSTPEYFRFNTNNFMFGKTYTVT